MTATNTASLRLMQSIGTITQNTVASGAREVVVDLTLGSRPPASERSGPRSSLTLDDRLLAITSPMPFPS